MSFTPEIEPKKHSNKNTLISIGIALLMLLSFIGGYFMQRLTRPPQVQTIVEVVELIDKVGYVYDPTTGEYVELDGDKVAESIANNFLDQYSTYYTKDEYDKIKEEAKGNYKGFGVSYDLVNNRVIKVVGNSPAEEAGLKVGDQISAGKKETDAQFTDLENGQAVSEFLTICNESQYTFKVVRDGAVQPVEISMKKAAYRATYVKYYDSEGSVTFDYNDKNELQVVENKGTDKTLPELAAKTDVCVVKLDAFEGQAFEQIKKAFEFASNKNITQLVLDLRGNGGGQLDILQNICSLLITGKGTDAVRIAYAQEKERVEGFSAVATSRCMFEKISIIADENTASASESLIGAMLYHHGEKYNNETYSAKDYYSYYNNDTCTVFGYGRLILVGADDTARTYGKGIMQTTYQLASGGALKLTTAKLFWPDYLQRKENATCIHGTGITTKMGAKAATAEQALARAIAALNENAIVNPAPSTPEQPPVA